MIDESIPAADDERAPDGPIVQYLPVILLRPERAARALDISVRTLYRRVAAGEIPVVRLGPKTVRFRPRDLQEWADGQAAVAGSPATIPVQAAPARTA